MINLILANPPGGCGIRSQTWVQQLVVVPDDADLSRLEVEVFNTIAMIRGEAIGGQEFGKFTVIHEGPISEISDQSQTLHDNDHLVNKATNHGEYGRTLHFQGGRVTFEYSQPEGDRARIRGPVENIRVVEARQQGDIDYFTGHCALTFQRLMNVPIILRYSYRTGAGIEHRDGEAILTINGPSTMDQAVADEIEDRGYRLVRSGALPVDYDVGFVVGQTHAEIMFGQQHTEPLSQVGEQDDKKLVFYGIPSDDGYRLQLRLFQLQTVEK